MPPWLRLISPGRSVVEPPPTSATTELVWCGARNGAAVTSPPAGMALAAAEWIIVAARDLERVSVPARVTRLVTQRAELRRDPMSTDELRHRR